MSEEELVLKLRKPSFDEMDVLTRKFKTYVELKECLESYSWTSEEFLDIGIKKIKEREEVLDILRQKLVKLL